MRGSFTVARLRMRSRCHARGLNVVFAGHTGGNSCGSHLSIGAGFAPGQDTLRIAPISFASRRRPPAAHSQKKSAPSNLVALVEGLHTPAYLIGARFDLLCWNRKAVELFRDYSKIPEVEAQFALSEVHRARDEGALSRVGERSARPARKLPRDIRLLVRCSGVCRSRRGAKIAKSRVSALVEGAWNPASAVGGKAHASSETRFDPDELLRLPVQRQSGH